MDIETQGEASNTRGLWLSMPLHNKTETTNTMSEACPLITVKMESEMGGGRETEAGGPPNQMYECESENRETEHKYDGENGSKNEYK